MNVAIFSGNLGQDAEPRQAGSKTVVGLRLAVTVGFGDSKETMWVDVNVWNDKSGRAAALRKGQRIIVQGRLNLRSWQGKDGQTRTNLELNTDSFEYADSKPNGAAPAPAYATAGFDTDEGLPF